MIVLVVKGYGEVRVLTLRQHYALPPVECGRGYTKAPECRRFLIGYCFSTCLKNGSRSLFRYPSLGELRRSRQIFPRRYRVVLDSARSFPTIFTKMRLIYQKKDRVLSGPKQPLVKWPLHTNSLYIMA